MRVTLRHMCTGFSLGGRVPKAYRSPCEHSQHLTLTPRRDTFAVQEDRDPLFCGVCGGRGGPWEALSPNAAGPLKRERRSLPNPHGGALKSTVMTLPLYGDYGSERLNSFLQNSTAAG